MNRYICTTCGRWCYFAASPDSLINGRCPQPDCNGYTVPDSEAAGSHTADARRAQPENEPLTCERCVDKGQYENEVEYGYPSPCTRCKRRSPDNYRRKPERSEG